MVILRFLIIFATSYMIKMKILKGEFDKKLELQIAPSIKAGFPSPADDYLHDRLDFNRDLIKHPEATFYGRVDGDSMIEVGICNGDIAVIDRSVEAHDGDIVVAFVNEEFTIKFLDLSHKKESGTNALFHFEHFSQTDSLNPLNSFFLKTGYKRVTKLRFY